MEAWKIGITQEGARMESFIVLYWEYCGTDVSLWETDILSPCDETQTSFSSNYTGVLPMFGTVPEHNPLPAQM